LEKREEREERGERRERREKREKREKGVSVHPPLCTWLPDVCHKVHKRAELPLMKNT